MRNFQDRMAEIRRRSGERIRARQRRNRIIGLCIPLVLCLSAGAAAIAAHSDTPNTNPTVGTQPVMETQLLLSEATLTASVNGVHRVYNDPEIISRVSNILKVITENGSLEESVISKADATFHDASGITYTKESEPVYCITVCDTDGDVTAYRLTGAELLDETNGHVFYLSQKQISDLLSALNIQ